MIALEDWALIRRLAAEGEPKAKIAARLGISRTAVIRAVAWAGRRGTSGRRDRRRSRHSRLGCGSC
ncbi:helix-turn-helix domain-containing protein [Sinomonas sp. G460-2]|uniref:helix-turn-helix domain-containing protein n=1 Tax=Sinomonas sp. G460-2 TaxID=3393464 RepID=UPI0039F01BC8